MRSLRFLLVVLALTAVGALAAGPAHAYPAGVIPTAAINKTRFAPGETVTVTVEHTTPGPMTMQLFSAPVTIGTGTVGADSTGSVSGQIPAGYSGAHTIQVDGNGGEIFSFDITVEVASDQLAYSLLPGCRHLPDGSGVGSLQVTVLGSTTPGTYRISLDPGGATQTVTVRGSDVTARFDDLASAPYTVRFEGGSLGPGGTTTPITVRCRAQGSGTPTPVSSGTTVVVTGGSSGGNLASTGTPVEFGVGTGLAALVAGGLVLAASRRRRSARH